MQTHLSTQINSHFCNSSGGLLFYDLRNIFISSLCISLPVMRQRILLSWTTPETQFVTFLRFFPLVLYLDHKGTQRISVLSTIILANRVTLQALTQELYSSLQLPFDLSQ